MKIYFVKKGDTLSEIALKHGVTVDAIMAVNPLITDPDDIKVAMKIVIPESQSAPISPSASEVAEQLQKSSVEDMQKVGQWGSGAQTTKAPVMPAELPKSPQLPQAAWSLPNEANIGQQNQPADSMTYLQPMQQLSIQNQDPVYTPFAEIPQPATPVNAPTGGWPQGTGTPPMGAWPQGSGTPPMGAWPQGSGTPPMGAWPQGSGTPPMGAWPQGAGTPPMGAWPQGAGTPPMGAWPQGAGTPPMGAWPQGPGTPPMGEWPQGPGTPPMGEWPQGAGTQPMGEWPQGSGTPPMGEWPQGSGTPPMGAWPQGSGIPPMGAWPQGQQAQTEWSWNPNQPTYNQTGFDSPYNTPFGTNNYMIPSELQQNPVFPYPSSQQWNPYRLGREYTSAPSFIPPHARPPRDELSEEASLGDEETSFLDSDIDLERKSNVKTPYRKREKKRVKTSESSLKEQILRMQKRRRR